MKTNYYISPRFFRRGVPFWVLPLVLFILLTVVLMWTLFMTQHNSSNDTFQDIKKSINGENRNIGSRYSLALSHFKNGSYYSSAQQFKALYYQKNISNTVKQQSGLYYAFSLLLEGVKSNNNRLIQDSRDVFSELINTVPKNSPYYSRVLLGYAKSTRHLNLNYMVGIDAALRQLANMSLSESLKRQIYLELGYYYFSLNNYPEANTYFTRASLYIDSSNFYETLLSKEDTDSFVLSLLKNNLIPGQVLSGYGMQIKQKLLKSSMRFINAGNHLAAKNILGTMINLFPLDSSSEDTYFLMGYIAQKEQNYKLALQYYNKVITNGYLDKDPIALFQMALIYYRVGNSKNAAYYFNVLVQKFPYSDYANEAQKWLEYFYPHNKQYVSMPTTPPISLDEKSPNYIFTQKANAQYAAPQAQNNNGGQQYGQGNTPPPAVNVNIDQSQTTVSSKQSDFNNTSTSLRRNEGSGNSVVQQRFPGKTTNNTTSNSNNKSSIDSNDINRNILDSNNTSSIDSNDLMADFNALDSFNKTKEEVIPPTPLPTKPVEEVKPQEPEPKVEQPEVEQPEEPQVMDNDLAEDFEGLDDDEMDKRPKFKPLF